MNVALLGEGFLADAIRKVMPHQEYDADSALICWVVGETPIVNGKHDPEPIYSLVREAAQRAPIASLFVLSSPLPVGSCDRLRDELHPRRFCVVAENVRQAHAADDFAKQDRVVAGVYDDYSRASVEQLYAPFTDEFLFMSPTSAEMVKHATNAFLAVEIEFVNSLADLCGKVGADPMDVAAGLRSDYRIGPNGYTIPGGPPGPHLLRDVNALAAL